MKKRSFFARKEQAEFIQRVYNETPAVIQELFKQEIRMLQDGLAGGSRVLEIGCGFGRAMEAIPDQALYTGIDIGLPYVLEASKQHSEGAWVCGDARRLPFRRNTFDAVFCIQNTLGNMEGIESQVIAEAKRVCIKGGRLIFSVYSEDSFETRRIWYDRLVDAGIFGRVWIDNSDPKIARSDTGWSSRCFEPFELRNLLALEPDRLEKLDSFLYFGVWRNP